jgi:hypothetical protein
MGAWLRWWGGLLASMALPVLVWSLVPSRGDVGPGPWIALAPAVGMALCVLLVVRGPRAASPLLVVAALGWAATTVAFALPDPDDSIGLGLVLMAGLGVVVLFTLGAMLVPPRPSAPDPRGGEAGQTAAD